MSNSPTTPFPLYLLPSFTFRRRSSSAFSDSTSSSSSLSSSPRQPTSFLATQPASHLRCQKCLADLIPTSSVVSKGFTGRHGRAYLVSPPPSSSGFLSGGSIAAAGFKNGDLPNTLTHKPQSRQLVTGVHIVSDISCRGCGSILGWKYVDAAENSQKYKIGKFILEAKRIVKGSEWDQSLEEEDNSMVTETKESAIEFDSQDEEECEDLFSGIWNPQLAARRRRRRVYSQVDL